MLTVRPLLLQGVERYAPFNEQLLKSETNAGILAIRKLMQFFGRTTAFLMILKTTAFHMNYKEEVHFKSFLNPMAFNFAPCHTSGSF